MARKEEKIILKDILDSGHYIFCKSFASWENAVQAAAEPLLRDRIIEQEYVNCIIKNVQEYGPYIIIAPLVAMPHATLGLDSVHGTCISFMKTEVPVAFDPNDPSKDAQIFFTLAAQDADAHLKNMVALSDFLLKDGAIDDLLKAQNADDLKEIYNKYKDRES